MLRSLVWYLHRTHHRQLYLFVVSVYHEDMMTFELTIVTTLGNGVVLEWMDPTSNIVGRHKVLRNTVPSSGSNSEGCRILVRPVCVDRGQAPDTSVRYMMSVRRKEKNAGDLHDHGVQRPVDVGAGKGHSLVEIGHNEVFMGRGPSAVVGQGDRADEIRGLLEAQSCITEWSETHSHS